MILNTSMLYNDNISLAHLLFDNYTIYVIHAEMRFLDIFYV